MKASDLRNMEERELRENWDRLEEQLFHLRFQSVTEEIQNPAQIKHIRKDIARIQTVLRERELAREKEEKEAPAEEKGEE